MEKQQERWRAELDALLSAERLAFDRATKLLSTIIRSSAMPSLVDLAKQALPSIRAAANPNAGVFAREYARRRLEILRETLSRKAASPFGKRSKGDAFTQSAPGSGHGDAAERRLLGLQAGGRLFGPEIRDAYRRAVRTAHPDAGGDLSTFIKIVAARDALLAKL